MSSPRDIEMINQNTDAEVAKVTALIGATNNTGGSATAGTAMAKLNGIFTNASTAASKATAAAKDAASIKTTVATVSTDAASASMCAKNAQTFTATNNKASKTGILSQKLAYVIGLLENTTYGLSALKNNRKICKASNTVLATIINAETAGLNNAAIEKRMLIVGFSGFVRLRFSIKSTTSVHNYVTIYKDNVYTDKSGVVQVKQSGYDYTDYTTTYMNIPVKDGDILRFFYRTSSGGDSVYCNLLTVCGTVSEAAAAAVAL